MPKIKDPTSEVTEKDLNDIDMLNGNASVTYNQIYPMEDGKFPKGAASPLKNKSQLISLFDDLSSNLASAKLTIITLYQSFIDLAITSLEWEGLPDDIDKFQLEYGLLTQGVIGILPIYNTYYVVNVLVDNENNKNDDFFKTNKNFMNLGYLPTYVKVAPFDVTFGKILNDHKLIVGQDIFLIRNNTHMQGMLIKINRFLEGLEKTLYQIEKNLVTASPKIIFFDHAQSQNADTYTFEENLNAKLTSENTAILMNFEADLLARLKETVLKAPFVPLELQDRIGDLIQSWTYFKNEIKEIFGFDVLQLGGKKERALNAEIDTSNSLSKQYLKHRIEIRNNDIKAFNSAYSFNISCKDANEQEENQIQESEYGEELKNA